jgi:hypothetical protein
MTAITRLCGNFNRNAINSRESSKTLFLTFDKRLNQSSYGNKRPDTFQDNERPVIDQYGCNAGNTGSNNIHQHIGIAVFMQYIDDV